MGRRKKRINLKNLNNEQFVILLIILIFVVIISCFFKTDEEKRNVRTEPIIPNFSLEEIPEYTSEPFVYINSNKPYFEENEYTLEPFEKYSDLDEKYRCGIAYANICKEIMPSENEERGEISSVTPTGWEQTKVDGGYL